jgi:hypothetical protein
LDDEALCDSVRLPSGVAGETALLCMECGGERICSSAALLDSATGEDEAD